MKKSGKRSENLREPKGFLPSPPVPPRWQLWCGRVAGRAKEAVRLEDVEPGERRTAFDLLVGSDCLAVQDLYNLSCCCTALQDMVRAQPAYQEKLVCRMFSRMVRLQRKEEELARVTRDAEARAERVAQQAPPRAGETDADRRKRERSEAQQARRHKASVAERRAHKIRADQLEKTVEQLESALSEMEGELDFTARRLRTVERREGTLGDSCDASVQTSPAMFSITGASLWTALRSGIGSRCGWGGVRSMKSRPSRRLTSAATARAQTPTIWATEASASSARCGHRPISRWTGPRSSRTSPT